MNDLDQPRRDRARHLRVHPLVRPRVAGGDVVTIILAVLISITLGTLLAFVGRGRPRLDLAIDVGFVIWFGVALVLSLVEDATFAAALDRAMLVWVAHGLPKRFRLVKKMCRADKAVTW